MQYVTMVVTEAGVIPPTSVPVIIREDAARAQCAAGRARLTTPRGRKSGRIAWRCARSFLDKEREARDRLSTISRGAHI